VYVHVPSIVPPATKFAVIGCLDPKPIIFLVNTALPAFKRLRPELMARQLEITRDDHPCLHYDSWLDCAEPHGYDMGALVSACKRDPTIVRGYVSDQLRERIIAAVEASRVIEKRKITWLLAGLRGGQAQS
jgi:hypothetical protein